MNKGLTITFQPLDEDYVLARLHWRERDVGGGAITLDVPVRSAAAAPKPDAQLHADARSLAARFARAFADTIDG